MSDNNNKHLDHLADYSMSVAEIDEQYGDIIPYQRDRIIQETRFLLNQSAEAMLEAGKRLILLKEHEPHGDWIESLNTIGINRIVAWKMMQASIKFSNVSTSKHLKSLNRSKLLELMALDNEEIHDLIDEGGSVRGLKLDDVDKMTVTELRAALRKTRHEVKQVAETKDLIIERKDKKLNQLDEQLAALEVKTRTATPDEKADAARHDLQRTAHQIKATVTAELRRLLITLAEVAPGQHKEFAAVCLIEIGRELEILRGDFDLPDHVSDRLKPDWMTDWEPKEG